MTLDARIPPPVVELAAALLMWALARETPGLDLSIPFRIPVAILFASVGIAIALSGVVAFRRSRTTVNPLRPSNASALVTSGIYRFTRNPMYLGMLVVLAGWAVALANAAAFLVLPFFVAYLTAFQIRPEERALEALFSEFPAYRDSVRRWI